MYALNLDTDGRILSATFEEYAPPEQPRVEILPDGDVSDYRYVDGEYVYDPLPKPEPEPEPQPQQGGDVTYSELATAIREGVNSYGQ